MSESGRPFVGKPVLSIVSVSGDKLRDLSDTTGPTEYIMVAGFCVVLPLEKLTVAYEIRLLVIIKKFRIT